MYMSNVRATVKDKLPSGVLRLLLPVYHFLRALVANIMFGFPARRLKIIAITGTNGKTTTAAYVASILRSAGNKVGVSSTAYFEVGDKHTENITNMTVTDPFKLNKLLAKMRLARVDWVVLEVTSHGLQQNRIWGIPIKAAIVTNLTKEHQDYHGNMKNYAAAKAKLLRKNPEIIVLNRDDAWFDYFDKFNAPHKMSFGSGDDADARITKASMKTNGSDISLVMDKTVEIDMKTQLPGRYNVYNAVAAASATYLLHIDKAAIRKGVAALDAIAGRLEPIDEGQNFNAIVDYAHTPDALSNVLETVRAFTKNRIILVFGSCGDRDKKKRPHMGKVAVEFADRIVLTDEEPYTEKPEAIRKAIMRGIEKAGGAAKTKEIADRRQGIEEGLKIARKGDSVLITGMGHQQYRVVGKEKLPWDDREVVRELLKENIDSKKTSEEKSKANKESKKEK